MTDDDADPDEVTQGAGSADRSKPPLIMLAVGAGTSDLVEVVDVVVDSDVVEVVVELSVVVFLGVVMLSEVVVLPEVVILDVVVLWVVVLSEVDVLPEVETRDIVVLSEDVVLPGVLLLEVVVLSEVVELRAVVLEDGVDELVLLLVVRDNEEDTVVEAKLPLQRPKASLTTFAAVGSGFTTVTVLTTAVAIFSTETCITKTGTATSIGRNLKRGVGSRRAGPGRRCPCCGGRPSSDAGGRSLRIGRPRAISKGRLTSFATICAC